ncbi:MAG TPA: HD domain-containing phosphohydrolase [Terriglobales bacterium]|nr:HD domain-containing phosphohydrolase [Terriglobales bacterium]
MPQRVPILYLILGVLVVVAVVPLWFYGAKVVEINRDKLETNEKLLQSTIISSLKGDIVQRQAKLDAMLSNLSSAIQIASGGNLTADHVNAPELRALLEQFVSSDPDVAYATLLNAEQKGIVAGRINELDPFMNRELEHGFSAAWEHREYAGHPLAQGAGKNGRTIMLVSVPVIAGGRFIGVICVFVDLQFLIERLREASQNGLEAYVVDRQGRLVAGADPKYPTGQDMTRFEIVKNFVEQGRRNVVATVEFTTQQDGRNVAMLGTYSPVAQLGWAVVAQKTRASAYASIDEMQRTARWLAIFAVVMSIMVSVWAARKITTPLETLTESSRAIARGDFSRRVELKSRTEIGELAQTFNTMTDDLERFVYDLKRAAEENRTLFLGSIQMLAGAVDEKDPYTRGHSDRVTRYSVLLATEMGLTQEEVENIRVAAQLHDVGKIGIEDRILKKPGALTPEEYEVMKTHTTKGATILRPVEQLKHVIPGIELHHESLDGRGYPRGVKGDDLPLMPRIITVADTFDAMTTNRPYQAAMDPAYVVRVIASMANTKFDPRVVAALQSVFDRGGFRLHRAAVVSAEAAAAATAHSSSELRTGVIPATPEITDIRS